MMETKRKSPTKAENIKVKKHEREVLDLFKEYSKKAENSTKSLNETRGISADKMKMTLNI